MTEPGAWSSRLCEHEADSGDQSPGGSVHTSAGTPQVTRVGLFTTQLSTGSAKRSLRVQTTEPDNLIPPVHSILKHCDEDVDIKPVSSRLLKRSAFELPDLIKSISAPSTPVSSLESFGLSSENDSHAAKRMQSWPGSSKISPYVRQQSRPGIEEMEGSEMEGNPQNNEPKQFRRSVSIKEKPDIHTYTEPDDVFSDNVTGDCRPKAPARQISEKGRKKQKRFSSGFSSGQDTSHEGASRDEDAWSTKCTTGGKQRSQESGIGGDSDDDNDNNNQSQDLGPNLPAFGLLDLLSDDEDLISETKSEDGDEDMEVLRVPKRSRDSMVSLGVIPKKKQMLNPVETNASYSENAHSPTVSPPSPMDVLDSLSKELQRQSISGPVSSPTGAQPSLLMPAEYRTFLEDLLHDQCKRMQQDGHPPDKIVEFIEHYIAMTTGPQYSEDESTRTTVLTAAVNLMEEVRTSPIVPTSPPGGASSSVPSARSPLGGDSVGHNAGSPHDAERTLSKAELLHCLQIGHQCGQRSCPEPSCIVGQDLLNQLDSCLHRERATWPPYILEIVQMLYSHGVGCNDVGCTVPMCDYFRKNDQLEFEAVMYRLQGQMLWRRHYDIDKPTLQDTLHQLCVEPPDVPLASDTGMPEQGVTYIVLQTLGRFNPDGAYWAKPTTTRPEYWTINKMEHSSLSVLEALRAPTQGVIPHLWAINSQRNLTVFNVWEGDTMSAYIRHQYPTGMSQQAVWSMLDLLLRAAAYVERLGLQFLRWQTSAISINLSGLHLADFSCAVMATNDLDPEVVSDIVMVMCPQILAPELLRGQVVLGRTDSWGVGLVAMEMSHGQMAHGHLRHLSPEGARLQIAQSPVPPECAMITDRGLAEFVTMCCQVSPSRRASINQLHAFVHQQLSESQSS